MLYQLQRHAALNSTNSRLHKVNYRGLSLKETVVAYFKVLAKTSTNNLSQDSQFPFPAFEPCKKVKS
jgi:hypothetical protein